MSTPSNSLSYGFKEFYLDDRLTGHSLVKPSLYVFETYGRIFSHIEESGCDAFLEVVSRVVEFALNSIALVFALVIAGLGVLVKGSSYLLSSEPSSPDQIVLQEGKEILGQVREKLSQVRWNKINLPAVKAAKEMLEGKNFANTFGVIISRCPQTSGNPEPSEFEIVAQEYQDLYCWVDSLESAHSRQIQRNDHEEGVIKNNGDCLFETFLKIHEMNQKHDIPREDYDFLKESQLNIEWILENSTHDAELQSLLFEAIVTHFKITNATSYESVKEYTSHFLSEINYFSSSFEGFTHAIELYAFSRRNKVPVFAFDPLDYKKEYFKCGEAFRKEPLFFKLEHGKIQPYFAHNERLNTVNWMKQHYTTDKELLLRLIDSIEGHFHAIMDKLENEKDSIQGMLRNELLEDEEKKCLEKRPQQIEEELSSIFQTKLKPLCDARGDSKKPMSYQPIEKLILEYLDEMQNPTVFGGAAELYALSQRYKICIHTYGSVQFTFGNEWNHEDQNIFNFQLKGKHYTPYIPA